LRFEGEPGLGEESVDECGPVLDAFEPVLDDRGELVCVGGGQVPRPFFMFDQALSIGCP
jgi:hypothetical protein